ncbi:hypothetical protein SLA2020_306730 [Shorea laevis]
MKVITWNNRGVKYSPFRRECKELIKMHRPDIFCLLETKSDSHDDSMAFMALLSASCQDIHCLIDTGPSHWFLTLAYTQPNNSKKEEFWTLMRARAATMQASHSQLLMVINCLKEFASYSGLEINLAKSKLFVSPNIQSAVARSLSTSCGIPLTSNLGTYLGVPIIHGRNSAAQYKYIIEKMQLKLASWKQTTLSLAGRRILIQSVTSSIPAYTMQTVLLPHSTCNAINKMNRNFLWGTETGNSRPHLVSWEVVCRSKDQGGLGLRATRDNNRALVAKLGWRILVEDEAPWCPIVMESLTMPVSHAITSSMNWDKEFLANLLPPAQVNEILSIPLSSTASVKDKIVWKYSDDGFFSIKSAFHQILEQKAPIPLQDQSWLWVWKLRCSERVRMFLWLILRNRVLTNAFRFERHLASSPICPRCGGEPETSLHLLRDCPFATQVWTLLGLGDMEFFQLPWPHWIKISSKKVTRVQNGEMSYDVLFLSAIWQLWKCRNRFVFNGEHIPTATLCDTICDYARDTYKAMVINGQKEQDSLSAVLVSDIRKLRFEFDSIIIQHAPREANSAADFLAGIGHSLPIGTTVFDSPPPGLNAFLERDMLLGVAFLRH